MRARCMWCGEIRFAIEDLECAIPARAPEALCGFVCPSCGVPQFRRTTPERAIDYVRSGAQRPTGPFPVELLEPHIGPAISWNDILDLRLAFAEIDQLEAAWRLEGSAPEPASQFDRAA